jgi:NTP pyrophosphatase (non-canonical NTP hydrolase)
MADERFLQDGFEKRLSHLIEECGETLAAAGKLQRWGMFSVNPLLPPHEQETNVVWLQREMADLRQALDRLDQALDEEFGDGPQ